MTEIRCRNCNRYLGECTEHIRARLKCPTCKMLLAYDVQPLSTMVHNSVHNSADNGNIIGNSAQTQQGRATQPIRLSTLGQRQ
nr:MAG TPA: DNA-directed RNA polymerase [Caudoviricetes sp.]